MINKSCSKQQKIWMEKAFIGLMGIVFLFVISCGGAGDATTATSPGSPPTPPSEVSFTETSFTGNEVTLSWTAPSPGTTDGTTPATISKYIVKYRVVGDNNFIEIDGSSQGIRLKEGLTGTSTSVTVIGLTPGTAYTFLITAVNSGGATTPDAERVVKTREASAPSAVDNLTVDNSASINSQVILRWTAPDDPGIDAEGNIDTISNYVVKYKDEEIATTNGGFIEINQNSEGEGIRLDEALTGTSTSVTVIGLTSGTAYTFLVAAVNSFGTTPDGEAAIIEHATPVEGATSPSTVEDLRVGSITSSNMVLSWSEPINKGTTDGSNPAIISKYIVEYEINADFFEINANDKGEGVRLSTALTTGTTATVIGLDPDTEYTFRVKAVNSGNKPGEYREVTGTTTIEEVEEATPPSAVKELNVDFITNDYVVLSWIEPDIMGTTDGNTLAELSKYVVEYKESASNDFDFVPINKTGNGVRLNEAWADTNTNATVIGLKPSTEYIFQVAAVNSGNKRGPDADVTRTTTEAPTSSGPSAVLDLGSSSTYDQVTLSWTAPFSKGTDENGNSFTISTYIVRFKETASTNDFRRIFTGGDGVSLSTGLTGGSTGVTVINLDPDTDYSFSVAAVNSGGKEGPEATIDQRTAVRPAIPDTPTGLSIQPAPTCNKIVDVVLTWNDTPGAASYNLYRDGADVPIVSTTDNSYTDTDKPAPGSHTYTVQACNSSGECSGKSSVSVTIDGSFTSIVQRGEVPPDADLIKYNKEIQDVFSISSNADGSLVPRYKAGASLVARYVKFGGTGDGTSSTSASGSLKAVMDGITDASADQVYVVFVKKNVLPDWGYKDGAAVAMKNYVAIVGGVQDIGGVQDGCLDPSSDRGTTLNAELKHRVFENDGNNLDHTALLYRMRLHSGNAEYSSVNHGGGMYNKSSSPALIKVTFSASSAVSGGGMYNVNSSPTLTEVLFTANSVVIGGAGGAVYNENSSPTLTRVTFRTNRAKGGKGGAMYNDGSSPLIVGATFSGNTAEGTTVGDGGAIYNKNSSPTLIGVTFSFNWAARYGGSMFNDNDGKTGPVIINGIFWDNAAVSGGAQFAISTSGTGQENLGIYNSIVQGGTGGFLSTNLSTSGTASVVISSKNIDDADPVLAGLDSYSLSTDLGGKILTHAITSSASPAVNKGLYFKKKNTSSYYSDDGSTWYTTPALKDQWPAPGAPSDADDLTATDARGYARVGVGGRPDIGAYEWGHSP